MATVLTVGDLLKGVFACYTPGQVGLNDYFWKVAGLTGAGPFTMEDLIVGMDTLAATDYTAYLSVEANFYGISLKRLSPTPSQPVETGALRPGSLSGGLTGKQVSPIITRRTATAGRGGRGRLFLPFPDATLITTLGEFSPTGIGLAAGIAADFLTLRTFTPPSLLGYQLQPVLVTRAVPGGIDIVASLPRTKIANQRRRGDFGRANSLPW